MNVELLRKIQAVIKAKPEQLDMGDWKSTTKWDNHEPYDCHTTYCIGGFACLLSGKEKFNDIEASAVLELTSTEQQDRLFFCTDWPIQFQGEDEPYEPTVEQVIARIDHFIATNGEE